MIWDVFLIKINKNRVYWGPGVPWGGPWGPLGLGDPGPWGPLGLGHPWALGTLGPWGPWALGFPGPWGPWALGTLGRLGLGPLGPAYMRRKPTPFPTSVLLDKIETPICYNIIRYKV